MNPNRYLRNLKRGHTDEDDNPQSHNHIYREYEVPLKSEVVEEFYSDIVLTGSTGDCYSSSQGSNPCFGANFED